MKSENYDFNNIESIMSIKRLIYKKLEGISSPVNNIEYILQRKATEHKKNGRMDLAIACLKKSNELMPYSNFEYSTSDYLRCFKHLKMNGQIKEAEKEEALLRKNW